MKTLLLWVLLFTLVSQAEDLMVVRGGREIRGRVLQETPTHVSFYTDYGKKVEVHKSRISVILRKGAVLAVNPAVGTLVGIKPEADVSKEPTANNKGPIAKSQSAMGTTLTNAVEGATIFKSTEPVEPVTDNSNANIQNDRTVASATTSETISSAELGFRVGPVLGITQSNVSAETITTSNRTGAEAGVAVEVPFLAGLELQPELLLSQAGYKAGDDTFSYKYIKIPVLLKYRHRMNEKINLTGVFGPSLGFRTEAKLEAAGIETDKKSTTKSTIMGMDVGFGGEYVFSSKMSGFLNLRYALQLNNLDTTIGATSAQKLRQLSFLTGMLFSL